LDLASVIISGRIIHSRDRSAADKYQLRKATLVAVPRNAAVTAPRITALEQRPQRSCHDGGASVG